MEISAEAAKKSATQTTINPNVSGQIFEEHKNDLTIFFNQDQFTIIKRRRKIHRLIFKHGLYVLMLLLGSIGVYGLNLLPQNLEILMENNNSEREHLAAQQAKSAAMPEISGLVTQLLYGKLAYQQPNISSVSNLITYQGIVLPKVAEVPVTKQLFDMTKFEKGQTTSNDISKLVQQLIIAPANKSSTLPKNATLKLSKGVIEDFNLQCLATQKVSNIVCNKFLATFFTYGKFYDIERYPLDLQTIQSNLKSRRNEHLQFCELIYEHTKRYRESTNILNSIMQQCPEDRRPQYKQLGEFITADQDIGNSIISNWLPTNADINAYKVLSIQQILYKNLQAGTLNKNYITSYLTYVQQLINRNNALSPLYKDITYRIHTNIFLPKLETYPTTSLTKTDINQIINQLTLLNKGNPGLGEKGLESQLTTQGLIQYKEIGTIDIVKKSMEELIRPLRELPDTLKIQRTIISDDQESVELHMEISSTPILNTFKETVKAKIILHRKNDMLYIESMTLINLEDLTTYLQNNIKGTNVTLPQLVVMINENISFYYQPKSAQPQKPLCETIKDNLPEANILSCNTTKIDLFKNGINYTFFLNNEVLVEVSVSDKELEQQINNGLQSVIITKDTTSAYIKDILQITKKETVVEKYTQQRVLINERMKRYLNITPEIEDIDESTFIVTFSVGEIKLQGSYDVPTHIISDISFIIDKESTLLIRGLTLPLNEENRGNLTELVNNPRLYLRLFNQAAFDKYERMLDPIKK